MLRSAVLTVGVLYRAELQGAEYVGIANDVVCGGYRGVGNENGNGDVESGVCGGFGHHRGR